MPAVVIGVSGQIASGKSELSYELSKVLNCPRVSFGGYVRKVAQEKGINAESREVLQSVGQSLIDSGWENFCKAVLGQVEWDKNKSLVVDGIRHEDAAQTLRHIVYPQRFFWVFISIEESVRLKRLESRGDSLRDRNSLESHSTEVQVGSHLIEIADLVVDGNLPVKIMVRTILDYLERNI